MQNYFLPHNFLALAYKTPNTSSLSFANAIKFGLKNIGIPIKKIGFSGTLDPFARGTLILGINNHTKLLSHIQKSYKTYQAVLFLGLESASLDTENIISLHTTQAFSIKQIHQATESLQGIITYTPPKFSAKHINGVRAYNLARQNQDFQMQETTMFIKNFTILGYTHPFLSFEVCVSEGGYVRSIGEIIAKNLGVKGSLCYLERTQEGKLHYHSLLQHSHNTVSQATTTTQNTSYNNQHLTSFSRHQSNNTLLVSLPIILKGVKQNTKLILLDIKNILKYDTISLTQYAKHASNGAKIILDSYTCAEIFSKNTKEGDLSHSALHCNVFATNEFRNTQQCVKQDSKNNDYCTSNVEQENDAKIFLADFGTFFGIIQIFQNGEVKYILNRIDKC